MTIHEYLGQVHMIDQKINISIKEYRAITTDKKSDIESIKAEQRRINREIDRYIDLKHEIKDRINSLGNKNMISILSGKYLQGMTIDQICQSMHYSRERIYQIMNEALDILSKKYSIKR